MKKIKIVFIIFIFVIIINNVVYGFNVTDLTGTVTEIESEKNLINTIVTVASSIGSILSVIILVVIGIKYMLGSVEEKAVYKKTLMPYVIGCILIFSASTIAGFIFNMVRTILR